MSNSMWRRDFLRAGAAAGAAFGLAAVASAEDKAKAVRIGVIGVGSRGTHLLRLALEAGVEVPALCDINEANLNRAIGLAAQARKGRQPASYSEGPTDYRRLLQRDDLDAVIIGTPMQIHAEMSIAAMRAGKHVLSEVAAAMTIDECWGLIHTAEETGKIYMLSENCCYTESVMDILNMVRKGIFGKLTYAECGYVHDCSSLMFEGNGALTWRGEMARDYCGNLYPTHSLGPVARWMGINRGDRLVSLVAASTGQSCILDYVAKRFPEGHPARKIKFKVADSTSVLIHTAKGAVIDLRYDIYSPRPVVSTTYYSLQGTKASYESRIDGLWIDGRSKGRKWEPLDAYKKEFEPALWAEYRQKATGSGHGGIDFFAVNEFVKTVRSGGPSPIDVCDAATWSSIIPLSAQSLADGGRPVDIPDFTRGKWEQRTM